MLMLPTTVCSILDRLRAGTTGPPEKFREPSAALPGKGTHQQHDLVAAWGVVAVLVRELTAA